MKAKDLLYLLEEVDSSLPKEWFDKFVALGKEQRGEPEAAMISVQMKHPGVYGFTLEHVGDLLHRMTEYPDRLSGSFITVQDKVKKTLRVIDQGYGFEKEIDDNIKGNIQAKEDQGKPSVTFEVAKANMKKLGQAYADAHRKLTPYNEAQRVANEAAIALGEFRFNDASKALHKLQSVLNKGSEAWSKYALEIPK